MVELECNTDNINLRYLKNSDHDISMAIK
jgi:hypothetical protein